jgi:hypothetical protein
MVKPLARRGKTMSDDSINIPPGSPNVDLKGRRSAAPSNLLQQGLEHVRERFHRQVDALEAQLRDRAQRQERIFQEREEQLEQKAIEVEHTRLQLQVEAERWVHEREAMIEQIEHDRRLLAEAWDRVERVQVKSAPTRGQELLRPAVLDPGAAEPAPSASGAAFPQPVLEEVLWQFQSVRRDVRRQVPHSCAG